MEHVARRAAFVDCFSHGSKSFLGVIFQYTKLARHALFSTSVETEVSVFRAFG